VASALRGRRLNEIGWFRNSSISSTGGVGSGVHQAQ
jgi:hypothetical protein